MTPDTKTRVGAHGMGSVSPTVKLGSLCKSSASAFDVINSTSEPNFGIRLKISLFAIPRAVSRSK